MEAFLSAEAGKVDEQLWHPGGKRENHIFLVVITAISYSHSHTAGREQQLSWLLSCHIRQRRKGQGCFQLPPMSVKQPFQGASVVLFVLLFGEKREKSRCASNCIKMRR